MGNANAIVKDGKLSWTDNCAVFDGLTYMREKNVFSSFNVLNNFKDNDNITIEVLAKYNDKPEWQGIYFGIYDNNTYFKIDITNIDGKAIRAISYSDWTNNLIYKHFISAFSIAISNKTLYINNKFNCTLNKGTTENCKSNDLWFSIGGLRNLSQRSCCNIYSIRIYNRALSEIELTRNYAIDKNRFGI